MKNAKKWIALLLALLAVTGSVLPVLAQSAPAAKTPIENEYPGSPGKYVGCWLLTVVTLGWYGISKLNKAGKDMNQILGEEKITTGWKLFLFEYITCGIYHLFWTAKVKNLLNGELAKRGIDYKITWWIFFSDYKVYKALNMVIADYNA